MENEVHEIFEKLGAPEGFSQLVNSLYTNKVEKLFLVCTGGSIVCFAIAYPIPHLRPYGVWLLLGAFISILLYSLSSFLGQISYILTPVKAYISELARKIAGEREIVKEISKYPQESIKAAKDRLEFERETLTSRFGFLLGVMDNLGIVPALIALYLSYAKIMNDPTLEKVPEYLLAFLAGIYLGAFFAGAVSSKLSLMALLLQQALELSEEREALGLSSSNDAFNQNLGTLPRPAVS